MLLKFQSLLVVLEEKSINKAALRLRMTQPALSRQMKSLEYELGGKLLERGAHGVLPTALCHKTVEVLKPVLESYTRGISAIKYEASGARNNIKVGYLISAAKPIVIPAIEALHNTNPEIKVTLIDMSPGEQIRALERGELDVALMGQESEFIANEFYTKKLCSYRVCVALSSRDTLAGRESIRLRDLASYDFIGINEAEAPGRNEWTSQIAKHAGFQIRFLAVTDGITHVLSLVDSESAVTLLPDYFLDYQHPGVRFVPLSDLEAIWDFHMIWQRGKTSRAVQVLIETLANTVST